MVALTGVHTLSTVYRTIGLVILAIVLVGFVTYVLINILFKAKPETGRPEIELAPNRKPYFSDEELEGPKLDRALSWGLVTLFVIGIGLPLYWIMEPGRQANATDGFNTGFQEAGAELFATTADGGFNCAGCHGPEGVGGVASYTINNPDGTFNRQVSWKAPALNTVLLRYSREEVTYVLTYGRPFSPMPAWGLAGNGPLNAQQIQTLVDYLESIQLTPEEAQAQVEGQLRNALGLDTDEEIDYDDPDTGEALFNLGLTDGFAGGAYSCGRCHTQGWSYATSLDELAAPGCGSALGPNLCEGDTMRQFPENDNPAEGDSILQSHLDFVTNGSVNGQKYGVQGQGTGRMPGFGLRPAEPALYWINKGNPRDATAGMMTPEMINAIVLYERTL